MKIADAQKEIRSAFLVVAGMFIFPLTRLGPRVIGRPGRVGPANSLYSLGAQVAFVLPLSLPVVGAAALYRIEWFFPSFMVVLGAHYLPFVFLYGMRMFAALAGILWALGIVLGLWVETPFPTGAWITAAVLVVFAVLGRRSVLLEEASAADGGRMPRGVGPSETNRRREGVFAQGYPPSFSNFSRMAAFSGSFFSASS